MLQCDTVVAGRGGITNPSNCLIRQEIYWARDFVVHDMYNGQMSCLIIKMTLIASKGVVLAIWCKLLSGRSAVVLHTSLM